MMPTIEEYARAHALIDWESNADRLPVGGWDTLTHLTLPPTELRNESIRLYWPIVRRMRDARRRVK